jgi:hypothetical protein
MNFTSYTLTVFTEDPNLFCLVIRYTTGQVFHVTVDQTYIFNWVTKITIHKVNHRNFGTKNLIVFITSGNIAMKIFSWTL